MPDEQAEQQTTSILHRVIPNRVMEWLFIGLATAVFIVVVIPVCAPHGHPHQGIHDLSNLRQAVMGIVSYAIDNDDQLPAHIKDAEVYIGNEDIFLSPYDHEESLVFEKAPKPGWYQHGSYWFLSANGLSIGDVKQPDTFMLAYRTPRPDHDAYLVGFLDGHAEELTREAFHLLMKQQGALLKESNPSDPPARFDILLDNDG